MPAGLKINDWGARERWRRFRGRGTGLFLIRRPVTTLATAVAPSLATSTPTTAPFLLTVFLCMLSTREINDFGADFFSKFFELSFAYMASIDAQVSS
jgi:hypothetical protein